MKYNNFLKNHDKKQPPPVHPVLLAVIWAVVLLIIALDIYRFVSPGGGLTVSDIVCDAGLVAVAVYFAVKFVGQRKDKKRN